MIDTILVIFVCLAVWCTAGVVIAIQCKIDHLATSFWWPVIICRALWFGLVNACRWKP